MKIYYASQSFYPHIGGVPTYLLNLCKEMVNLGNDVVEVHLRPAGEEHYEEIEGVVVHRVPKEPIDKELMEGYSKFKEAVYKASHYYDSKNNKPIDQMEGFLEYNQINEYFGEEIKNLLEMNPADIVHIHDFQLLFAYRYVPRGTPLILTWHIPFIKNMAKPIKEFLVKHLNEYDKIIFSSQEYIDAAIKAGVHEEKIELIHPIANTNLFRVLDINKEQVRKKFKLPEKAKIILSVQRVDPKSGHEQLIRALPLVKKKIPNVKLVFVGGQSLSNKLSKDRAELQEQITALIKDLKLEKDVIFTGTIDYNKLPEVYNACDVNALCSKNEGFGLAVTEGMACGLPVIGTNVGGIPLQVKNGKNGFLAMPGDYKKTAEQLITILADDALREKMGKAAVDIVEEQFGINIGIEKHAALYNTLIGEKDEFKKVDYMDATEIKGIITDLDHTLTEKKAKDVFDEEDFDKELLRELKKLGIDLFLATSRPLIYAKAAAKKFKLWKAIICENGSVIYFPDEKKTITISTYHMRRAKKKLVEKNYEGTTTGKVAVTLPTKYEEEVIELLGKTAQHIVFSHNVDETILVPEGVNKGLGVRLVMQHLNVDLDKTICIGDGENDIDLFLNPGFKIAVANAHPKLKELANQVTEKPRTQGVREIIEKIKSNS